MRCIAEIADIGMTIDKKLRLTLNLQGASLVQLVQLQTMAESLNVEIWSPQEGRVF